MKDGPGSGDSGDARHGCVVALAIPPDGTDRLFLVQQFGKITILPKDRDSDKEITFLDVTDRPLIKQQFEEGLLGLAFHPDYARNRKFYIYYSLQDPKHTRVSEMQTFADDPNKADLSTERVLLEIPQPFWNHNSGNILFGPDGYLYIAIGDGGKSNDPQRFSQNTFVYNGKILRIDVNKRAGNRPYGLPEDNPFLDKPGHHPEIFALGLRNPWGLTFHPDTNQLWAADVGQNAWEEINIITKGGNYGWSFNEATHPANARTEKPSKDVQFIAPIHEYGREDGISITGGIHYRGAAVPQLQGKYIYGDWGFGTIWALETKDGKKTENTVIFKRPEASKFRPTAFVEDADGELLILSHDHKIYTISPKK
ncbi:PQQ-dependent sugar dehydrogenase [Akkermansiaceae bacterium]|nr:PQQ-dependent sugar dehydrogenase [Akkermansiaceae bacterium]